jgi:5-methylcytosine-specific restriction endonuclease McrA
MASPVKTCRKCLIAKPLSDWGKHPTRCLQCLRVYAKERHRILNPDSSRRDYPIREKVCKRCSELKPREAFGEKKSGHIREMCRECAAAAAREHRIAHPEKFRAAKSRWLRKHPEKRTEWEARRRTRKRGGKVGRAEYSAILRRQGFLCGICGDLVLPSELQFDHVVPRAVGGAHIARNIQVAHAICNRKKHSKVSGIGRYLYQDT